MSMPFVRWSGPLALTAVFVLTGRAPAQDAKKDSDPDLNHVALEVNALQTLYSLNLNDTQLKKLKTWAKEAAQKPGKREPAKASKEYREKLLELHTTLVKAEDPELIDRLIEELDELREAEKPAIDDNVDMTDSARKRAPAALKLLLVPQLTTYIANLNDDLKDPLDFLLDSLASVRGLEGNEWKQRREEIVDDLVRLAAGVDGKKAAKLNDQLVALLSKAHSLSDDEFKAKRADLEKTARKLLGDIGPLEVVRNAVEYALAELLSNPRLDAALAERLKNAK